MTASSLIKRVRQLEDDVDVAHPSKQLRIDHGAKVVMPSAEKQASMGLGELTGFCDYVAPPNTIRNDRMLRAEIVNRHLDSFFDTIHIFIPLFDENSFRERLQAITSLFGDRRLFMSTREDVDRPQFVCLLYAVLALGALYENDREDSSSWASWYFAEAQDMLGRLLGAANLPLVQAALLQVSEGPLTFWLSRAANLSSTCQGRIRATCP